MDWEKDFIKNVQKRVANCSIGASILRGQGSGLSKKARCFLINELELGVLKNMDSRRFTVWLNNQTDALVEKFLTVPPKRNCWGAARKTLNVFLENAFYDKFLCKAYSLHRLESVLELPFDRNTKAGLTVDAPILLRKRIPEKILNKWKTIRDIEKNSHGEFEKYAAKIAPKKFKSSQHKSRIYLDLTYWRNSTNEKKDSNH